MSKPLWFYGTVKVRGPSKVESGWATQTLSSTTRPTGIDFDAPLGIGSHVEEGDDERVVLVEVRAPEGRSVEPEGLKMRLHQFLALTPPPPGDEFKLIGTAILGKRVAVHKETGKEGGEADEYRFDVRFPVEDMKPLHSQLLGYFNSTKRFVLAVEESEADLEMPEPPVKRRPGRPPKEQTDAGGEKPATAQPLV